VVLNRNCSVRFGSVNRLESIFPSLLAAGSVRDYGRQLPVGSRVVNGRRDYGSGLSSGDTTGYVLLPLLSLDCALEHAV